LNYLLKEEPFGKNSQIKTYLTQSLEFSGIINLLRLPQETLVQYLDLYYEQADETKDFIDLEAYPLKNQTMFYELSEAKNISKLSEQVKIINAICKMDDAAKNS